MDFSRAIWLYILLEFFSLSSLQCHEQSSDHTDSHSCGSLYGESCNTIKNELTEDETFQRGHMKPFGSHRPPDYLVEELPHMISPQDFYMNYVAKHKPVVFKGKLIILVSDILKYLIYFIKTECWAMHCFKYVLSTMKYSKTLYFHLDQCQTICTLSVHKFKGLLSLLVSIVYD